MARPRKDIDPRKVEALAMIGCPPNEIAAELDCGERTIHRRFGTAVKKGHEKCKTRIRSKLYAMAMQGNMAAIIFLAKAICGMREPSDDAAKIEHGLVLSINLSQAKQIEASAEPVRQSVKAMYATYRPTLENGNGNGKEKSHPQ